MPIVHFLGKVFPTAHNITLANHPGVTFRDAKLDIAASIVVCIRESNIRVDCEVNQFNEQRHLGIVSMFAYDSAKAIVDLLAFSKAIGLTVILDQFSNVDGVTRPFMLHEPALRSLSRSVSTPTDFNTVFRIVMTDTKILLAVRDLVEAIDEFHEGPIKCGRSVDAIRAWFVPPGGKRDDGWAAMRDALGVSRSYIETVMDAAKGPRHGDRSKVRDTITFDVVRNAWIIMDRFLEYNKRGRMPLPVSEFPIL